MNYFEATELFAPAAAELVLRMNFYVVWVRLLEFVDVSPAFPVPPFQHHFQFQYPELV